MDIEAKDSITVYNLLQAAMQEDHQWVAIPGDKPVLSPSDIKAYSTFANAAEATEKPTDHLLLLFAVFVELSQAMEYRETKKASKPLPTHINLDLEKIAQATAQEAQVQRKVEFILAQIGPYGFGKELAFDLRFELQFNKPSFTVNSSMQQDNQKLSYQLFFREADGPVLDGFKAILRSPLPPSTGAFGIINVNQLDRRMSKVDWENELLDNKQRPEDPFISDSKEVPGILKALEVLEAHSLAAREIAALLKFKYWEGTPNEHLVPFLKAHQLEFNNSISVKPGKDPMFTKSMSANLLFGRAVGITGDNDITLWHQLKAGRFRVFEETGNLVEKTMEKLPLEFSSVQDKHDLLAKLRNGDPVEVIFKKEGVTDLPARIEVDPSRGIQARLKGTIVSVVEEFTHGMPGVEKSAHPVVRAPSAGLDEQTHPTRSHKR
ncbi:MAG: hypothetical protein BGO55_08845 [Sphingobacteriales bacterium 50-39]|nr:MAG: hypothetical protein BGO55_08845 [Sphingobacteriales bacterium 50-39]